MNRLSCQAAQQYRAEDRKRFIELCPAGADGRSPDARAALRGQGRRLPVREGRITDRKATREQLEADLESEEGHVHGPGCGHDHDHAEKPKAKKAAAKKDAEPKGEVKEPKAKTAAKKADIVEKSEAPKPAKPLKSEPANKAAAKAAGKGWRQG